MSYEYKAKLVRVIDGDTVVLDVDLGFHVTIRETFRLYGVNAPEMKGESRDAGQAAKAFVESWFRDNDLHAASGGEWFIRIETHKPRPQDKYGRWLAEVYGGAFELVEVSLAQLLVAAGHAVEAKY